MDKLEEINEMVPTAWKFEEVEDGIIYSMQFDEVPWKWKRALMQAMTGWTPASYGWHKASGNQIFVFKKKFRNSEEWDQWADSFPLQIREKRYWGSKEKTILRGKKGLKNGNV